MGGDEHGPMGRIEILATWALRARTFGGPLSDRVVVRSGTRRRTARSWPRLYRAGTARRR